MEKSDIQKLNEFVCRNSFSSYRFCSDDQPDYSEYEPARCDLSFRELFANEYPDVIFLRDGRNWFLIDRLKSVKFKYVPSASAAEITVVAEKTGFGPKEERTYKIQARKIS